MLDLLKPKPRAERATVTISGCRGYVVTLHAGDGHAQVLNDRRGRARHFTTLDSSRSALRRPGARRAVLVQQHACEALSADQPAREDGLVILDVDNARRG